MPLTDQVPQQPRKITNKLIAIILLFAAAALVYRNQAGLKQFYLANFSSFTAPPCSQPITYRIGSVDPRFGISTARLKQAISDAAQIWDKAAGKQLFQYADNGAMPINLVYDNRQQAIDQLKKLNLNVDNTENSYNQLKTAYDQYQSQFKTAQQDYDNLQQQYNNAVQNYNDEVQSYNRGRGATPEQVAQLNAERDQLSAMKAELDKKYTDLQTLVSNINALAVTLNQVGSQLNKDVSVYNQNSASLGEFEEGVFSSNGFSKQITIYEFTSYQTLVRVLAHELGHSLGLNHVDDANAIMYKLNQSKNLTPTAADKAELKAVCKF